MRWFRARALGIVTLAAVLASGSAGAFAQQQPPLKVGLVYSYSGAPEYIGKGIDAAIAAYQAMHGDSVAGRKVVIIKRDDTGIAPDVARRMAQELVVQDNVDILIGAASTTNGSAIADISTQAQKPFFAINVGTSNVLEKAPYSVRFGFTLAQITGPLGKWVVQRGMKSGLLLYQDYGPGVEGGSEFRKSFEANGGNVLGEIKVPVTNQDYSAYAQRVHDAKPQVLYAFFNYLGGLAMLKAASTANALHDTRVVSTPSIIPDSEVAAAPTALALGLISVQNYSYTHDSKLNRAFVAAFRKAYGDPNEVPNFDAAAAFDVMNAIYTIAKAQHGSLDPDKTMAEVRGMRLESPRGPLQIDAHTRSAVENVYIRQIELLNGKPAPIEIATVPLVRDPNEHFDH
jgi:branched-chain amino acid transport system substrate-binding protein